MTERARSGGQRRATGRVAGTRRARRRLAALAGRFARVVRVARVARARARAARFAPSPFAVALCACAHFACAPGAGGVRLDELRGRAVDLETGAPIAGALVVEWYVGGGVGDGARPVHHARWTTTAADGSFALAAEAADPWTALGASYGPELALVHPDYGLQRQARREGERWRLEGDARRAEAARRDLDPYCRGERDDEGARRIRAFACPPRPERPAAERVDR
ncbi:MAG: hypothetical protein R3E88_14620 [Myxococcota bacterium]